MLDSNLFDEGVASEIKVRKKPGGYNRPTPSRITTVFRLLAIIALLLIVPYAAAQDLGQITDAHPSGEGRRSTSSCPTLSRFEISDADRSQSVSA